MRTRPICRPRRWTGCSRTCTATSTDWWSSILPRRPWTSPTFPSSHWSARHHSDGHAATDGRDLLIELASRLKFPAFTTAEGARKFKDYPEFVVNFQQATLCFPLDSGEGQPEDWSHGAGLAITHAPDAPDIEVVLVGFGASWSNQEIADDAHAGIAIRTLGSTPSLIWYQPGLSDAADYADSAGSGWPGWVGPVSSLIAAAFVLFALAIGRRLGPPPPSLGPPASCPPVWLNCSSARRPPTTPR